MSRPTPAEIAAEIAAYARRVVDEAPEASPELVEEVRAVLHPRIPRPAPRKRDA